MSPAERESRRAQAQERLAALRLRTHQIRVYATATAVALFIVLFAGIYIQLATGHDPALAAEPAAAATSDPDTGVVQTDTTSSGASAMTTQQS